MKKKKTQTVRSFLHRTNESVCLEPGGPSIIHLYYVLLYIFFIRFESEFKFGGAVLFYTRICTIHARQTCRCTHKTRYGIRVVCSFVRIQPEMAKVKRIRADIYSLKRIVRNSECIYYMVSIWMCRERFAVCVGMGMHDGHEEAQPVRRIGRWGLFYSLCRNSMRTA